MKLFQMYLKDGPAPWSSLLASCRGGKLLGDLDVCDGGQYQVAISRLWFAVAVVEAVDVQESRPGVVLALERVECRVLAAQPQEGAPGLPI